MTEVTREAFGRLPPEEGGGTVEKFTLKSDSVRVEILTLGCIVAALQTKDRHGAFADVVLGFDSLEGEVAAVQGTAFDLRAPVELGQHLQRFHLDGFDHNFCLRPGPARHAGSGRSLEVRTTQPGLQFYTGNNLDGSLRGKGGAAYAKHSAFCLETQSWPDAVNKPHFPDTLLRPGHDYDHTTWLLFAAA
uniref:Galactose mutarotase n=1 Tax=Nothoprocta perdicaria TaxID=30464 RepID=A0A8C7A422_NOTPE